MSFGLRWKAATLSFAFAGLVGCTIGNWQICGPQTPAAYCMSDAQRQLNRHIPSRDYWEAPNQAMADERAQQWVACGGDQQGGYFLTKEEIANSPQGASRKKHYEIQRCMMRKGYRYTGKCDNEIASQRPACQARKNAQ